MGNVRLNIVADYSGASIEGVLSISEKLLIYERIV